MRRCALCRSRSISGCRRRAQRACLGKLVVLYDDNRISIDSDKAHIDAWFSDDTPRRFGAYGWHVIPAVDGHDVDAVDRAIAQARAVTDRPSLICCKTVIAKGAPNTADTGGGPRGPPGGQ